MHSRYFDEPEVNSAKSTPITTSAASHAPSLVLGAVLGVPLGAPEATGVSLGAPEATGVSLGAPVAVDTTVLLEYVALALRSTGDVQRVGATFDAARRRCDVKLGVALCATPARTPECARAAIGATSDTALWSSERARAAIGATRCILPLKSRMNSHTPLTEVSAQ